MEKTVTREPAEGSFVIIGNGPNRTVYSVAKVVYIYSAASDDVSIDVYLADLSRLYTQMREWMD